LVGAESWLNALDIAFAKANWTMIRERNIALFIDPFTHHFERDRLFDAGTEKNNGADILAPWTYLRRWFSERGVRVHTADLLDRSDLRKGKNVFISFGLLDRYKQFVRRLDLTLSAFFAFESPVVEPQIYRELGAVQRNFKRVFTFTDSESLLPFLDRPLQSREFRIPHPFERIDEVLWGRKNRKFLIMMNHNKVPALDYRELYRERMRALQFFAATEEIDLYGVGWDGPSFQMGSRLPGTLQRLRHHWLKKWQRIRPVPLLQAARKVYHGPASGKPEVMSQYNFALTFENVILKDWITEKIFDCFAVGTVPIYWGAPNIDDHVPQECFIDMRKFANYYELRSYLNNLSPNEIEVYRTAGREFLLSPRFRPFTKEFFTERLARIVQEDTGEEF
jgi:alpha(1,3/1,4) fucosyltransferase